MRRIVGGQWAVLLGMLLAGATASAGTTVITHGFAALATDPPDWTLTMARAILAEAGDASDCGDASPPAPVGTVFTYQPGTGEWQFECGSPSPGGAISLGSGVGMLLLLALRRERAR